MNDELEKYLEYLKLKNFSPATVQVRRQSIEHFSYWLGNLSKFDVREVSIEDLRNYFSHMQKKNFSCNTIDTRIRSIKLFFEYLENRQMILINPAERLELPSLGKRWPVNILTEEEVKQLLQSPNLGTSIGIRDRAIMELLYSTAIRRSECANLNIFDLDLNEGYIRINQGKGRKDRIVPLGKKASEYLKIYIEKVYPEQTKELDSNYLFYGYCKNRLEGETINRMIQRYVKLARLNKPVTVHSFRRAAVTHMLKNGASPLYIQKMLGHSTNETLKKYVRLTIKDVKEAHQKHHPMEKIK
ncbi:MAG: site-specific tyrosine recombinase XerC [uncultured bacterium]|nr:MAG: site-specific tyrosine recombinase XerC [uncultured bacterium]